MPTCTVTRTHANGEKLDRAQWSTPTPGPVRFETTVHPALNRTLPRLRVLKGNGSFEDLIPCLYEPHLLALMSDQGMMCGGFEEIDGKRYYQSWLIRWVDE